MYACSERKRQHYSLHFIPPSGKITLFQTLAEPCPQEPSFFDTTHPACSNFLIFFRGLRKLLNPALVLGDPNGTLDPPCGAGVFAAAASASMVGERREKSEYHILQPLERPEWEYGAIRNGLV